MPVSIPYTFTQTDDEIAIQAKILSGTVNKNTVHLDVTRVFLKLNCPPSLLQLDLYADVDPDKVRMTIVDNNVEIKMRKASPASWASLTIDSSMDKISRLQRRQSSMIESEQRTQQRAKDEQSQRKKMEKAALEAHWSIDAKQRAMIHEIENRERVVAMEEIQAWKNKIGQKEGVQTKPTEIPSTAATTNDAGAAPATATDADVPALDDDAETQAMMAQSNDERWKHVNEELSKASTSSSEVQSSSSASASSSFSSLLSPPVAATPAVPLPPVRRGAKVEVTFTANATPTPSLPARESTMAQKMAFKATKAGSGDASSSSSSSSSNASTEDVVPLFRKEKADTLYRNGDIMGAIAAYTSAIDLDAKLSHSNGESTDPMLLIKCLSNRAMAYLKLASNSKEEISAIASSRNMLRKCILDCTGALKVLSSIPLPPTSDSNHAHAVPTSQQLECLSLKLKNLHRRSTCYAWMGLYKLARADLGELITIYEDASMVFTRAQRAAELDEIEAKSALAQDESASASSSSSPSSAASSPSSQPLPTLPSFDLTRLREEASMFDSLLSAFSNRQVETYKNEGDRLLGEAGVAEAKKDVVEVASHLSRALTPYTQSLTIHPGALGVLSNRAVALLKTGRAREALQDATLAIAIWEECWLIPKTGLDAIKPPAGDGVAKHALTPLSSSTNAQARQPPASAIASRVRLFVRRGTARLALNQPSAALADFHHALALTPLSLSSSTAGGGNDPTKKAQMISAAKKELEMDIAFIQYRNQLHTLRRKAKQLLDTSNFTQALESFNAAIDLHRKRDVTPGAGRPIENVFAATLGRAMMRQPAAQNQSNTDTFLPFLFAPQLAHVHELSMLLSDRAVVYLRLQQYQQVVQACTVAIQMWQQQIEQELQSARDAAHQHNPSSVASLDSLRAPIPRWFVGTLVRRGSARAFLGLFDAATHDYEEALRQWDTQRQPDEKQKQQVQHDLERIKQVAKEAADEGLEAA